MNPLRYCPQCGHSLFEEDKFCGYCGTAVAMHSEEAEFNSFIDDNPDASVIRTYRQKLNEGISRKEGMSSEDKDVEATPVSRSGILAFTVRKWTEGLGVDLNWRVCGVDSITLRWSNTNIEDGRQFILKSFSEPTTSCYSLPSPMMMTLAAKMDGIQYLFFELSARIIDTGQVCKEGLFVSFTRLGDKITVL